MDAAIVGLVGLGGLYTIANQEKKSTSSNGIKSQPNANKLESSLVETKEPDN